MILAGDVGGTKARLALYSDEGGKFVRKEIEQYSSQAHGSLEEIAQKFFQTHPAKVSAACFGVPGPVHNGRVKVTNLPWEMSEQSLSETLGIPKVRLVNDLVATAAAIPYFDPENLICLHAGNGKAKGIASAVVAPGTGLGHALLFTQDGDSHVLPSEGGHSNFAPVGERQVELMRYLERKFNPVSVERVLCGPGLINIYDFVKNNSSAKATCEVDISSPQASAQISNGAKQGDPLCAETMNLFCEALGAHASNVLLNFMATGGIYLGGGIPPKIADKLKDGTILKGYLNKEKLRDVVESTPLYIISDDYAAVIGAAHLAERLQRSA